MVCFRCWFRIQTLIFEIPTQKSIFGQFWAQKVSCLFCLKIGTHGISSTLIVIPTLIFWNSNPKIHFWANLDQKSQSCPFCLKIGTHGIFWKLILIPALIFWIPKSRFIFGQNNSEKVKLSIFAENWYTKYHEDSDFYWNLNLKDTGFYSEISFLKFQT